MSGKILIVDDERTIRMAVRDTLSREGHLAVTASTGEEAVRRCKTEPFDLLITDLKMPGMSGLVLIRHVRSLCPQIRTILITAYGSAESAIEALRLGVSDYMVKPFRLSELRLTASRLLTESDAVRCATVRDDERGFDYRFYLGKSNWMQLSGATTADSKQESEAARDAVRVAARTLSMYAARQSAEFDVSAAAEAISDMLYFERLSPVMLGCTRSGPSGVSSAMVGASMLPAPVLGEPQQCCPAAGSFPGLRAVSSTVIGEAAPSVSAAGQGCTIVYPRETADSSQSFSLESDKVDLKLLVEKVGHAARAAGLNVERTNDVVAAVNEAVLNAIEHGYGSGNAGKVDVQCRVMNREMVATVRDYGKGFDVPNSTKGGGFATISRLMDRVAVESAPGAGTTVYLAKSIE